MIYLFEGVSQSSHKQCEFFSAKISTDTFLVTYFYNSLIYSYLFCTFCSLRSKQHLKRVFLFQFNKLHPNMKKLFLLTLVCIVFSCNQDNKTSQNTISADSSKSKNETEMDALKASPANFKLLLENQYVRVLEYTLNPGEKDQWHTHPAKSSYVVSGGSLKVYLENGDTILANETAGTASWMDRVGKHYVENTGSTPVKIILTEIKSLQQPK